MKRLALRASALASVLFPLVAAAQLPPPRTPEPRQLPRPGLDVPPRLEMPPRVEVEGITVTWFGQSAFLLEAPAGATVLIDPFAAAIGLPLPKEKLTVDVVAITHEHPDHNNVAGFVEGSPKVIHGLAEGGKEYAKVQETVKGVRITTVPALHDDVGGKERGKDAIFVFDIGGLRVAHLGDLGQSKLTAEQKEALGKVDVLLVPVGGHYTIGPEQAAAIVKDLAPRQAVIPMHYRLPGLAIAELGPVDPFLAAFPADRVRKVDGPSERFVPMVKEGGAFEVVVLRP